MHFNGYFHKAIPDWSAVYSTLEPDEVLCGALKGILGPGEEPVDGGAVDKGREVSNSVPEVFSNGTHTDHQVEVLLVTLDEMPEFLV